MQFNILVSFFFLFALHTAFAQTNTKDFYKTKAPSIQNNTQDSLEIFEEDQFENEIKEERPNDYSPKKNLSIVSEDTTSTEEGETSIVEVSEQLNYNDSIWVTYAEYYSVWDSRNVNPYKIDGSKFSDTVVVRLYDSTQNLNCAMPLNNSYCTSNFGMRHSRWHYGIDLDLETGDPVFAAFNGVVRIRQFDGRGYGNYVMLRHYNGFETLYGHLSRLDVEVGQLVKAGEQIGLGGNTGRSTGSHLHFEVRYEGNAINPEHMYDFKENKLISRDFKLAPQHFEYLKTARKVYYHKVRSGETLSSISRKYRVPLATIYKLNHMRSKSIIRVGMKIRIR